jgi:Domain of unknown function (DUF6362)
VQATASIFLDIKTMRWLEVDDAKLVWARAERVQWKQITWQFGMSRTAATRRLQFGWR